MEQQGTSGPCRVCVVDDDDKLAQAIAGALRRAGGETRCFPTAEECLKELGSRKCDVVLTDYKLPGKSGLDLLSYVRRHFPWLPVIVMTQYGDVGTAVKAMKLGAEDFLEKPIDVGLLKTTIQSSLKKRRHLDQGVGKPLSPCELEVLSLILDGKSNSEAAEILHRSRGTVEVHRKHIMRKLGARNVVDLVMKAVAMGLHEHVPDD